MIPSEIIIGPMEARDLGQVVALERAIFPDPWSRTIFEEELRHRERSYSLAARVGEEVVGYTVAWFVLDELHLGNVAVAFSWRRRGIGDALIGRVLAEGLARGSVRATLEVRVSNQVAISVYEKHGFRSVALRRGYYRDNGEDALIMIADLPVSESEVGGDALGGSGVNAGKEGA